VEESTLYSEDETSKTAKERYANTSRQGSRGEVQAGK
jgi:hypothetical protein